MAEDSYPAWKEYEHSELLRGKNYPRLAEDCPTFLGSRHALTPDELQGADIAIIGAPYAASWGKEYAGVPKESWLAAPTRVRQQSARYLGGYEPRKGSGYRGGYIQELDLDVLEHINIVDYGDCAFPPDVNEMQTVDRILMVRDIVESKVHDVLAAGAIPVVIGQNSPAGSAAIARPLAVQRGGPVGMVSLDTHWDSASIDAATMDPRVAGAGNWKKWIFDNVPEYHKDKLVEIGERGMLELPEVIREYRRSGATFLSSWDVRERGLRSVLEQLPKAFAEATGTYFHLDLDVLGGAGPAPGDILGELAEPMGLTDFEVIRIAHEVGRLGADAMSFICIPPGSPVTYRVVVYCILYFAAGLALRKQAAKS